MSSGGRRERCPAEKNGAARSRPFASPRHLDEFAGAKSRQVEVKFPLHGTGKQDDTREVGKGHAQNHVVPEVEYGLGFEDGPGPYEKQEEHLVEEHAPASKRVIQQRSP